MDIAITGWSVLTWFVLALVLGFGWSCGCWLWAALVAALRRS